MDTVTDTRVLDYALLYAIVRIVRSTVKIIVRVVLKVLLLGGGYERLVADVAVTSACVSRCHARVSQSPEVLPAVSTRGGLSNL